MKIYVVTAQFCEETEICGVTVDKSTAKKLAEIEEKQKTNPPDAVYVEEYETDEYILIGNGVFPFEVRFFSDRTETFLTTMRNFRENHVYNLTVGGEKCIACDVFAINEKCAFKFASEIVDTFMQRKRSVDAINYVSKPHPWKNR